MPFNPPVNETFQKRGPLDANATLRFGGVDESLASGRLQGAGGVTIMKSGGKVNDSANETIGAMYAMLNKEENDMSETGGENHIDYDMLKEQKRNMGAPGGTGSSDDPYKAGSALMS